MDIREARPDDNEQLMALQLRCPQGMKLTVSNVNTPDFFARTKAYKMAKVFVALDGNRVVGSAAIAVRKAVVNGGICPIGYGFQGFVEPQYRRKGIVNRLAQQAENFALKQGAVLIYGIILEDNEPSMRWLESRGYKPARKLIIAGLPLYRKMAVSEKGKVRPARQEDLPAIAAIVNKTWQGFEMFEPTSAEAIEQFIMRTPEYDYNNLMVWLEGDQILACLGYWDWRKIMRITVEKLSLKIRLIGMLGRAVGMFKALPAAPKSGDVLKQIVLTPIGFQDPLHLAALLRHLNNRALQMGIEQIFCVCEPDHAILKSMKGFIRINTQLHLYVRSFRGKGLLEDKPVWLDGIDL